MPTFANRKSLRALMQEQQSTADVIQNPKTGKLFFTCGSIRGYISKKLAQVYQTTPAEDVEFADVTTDDGVCIPCLFLKGKNNTKKVWR